MHPAIGGILLFWGIEIQPPSTCYSGFVGGIFPSRSKLNLPQSSWAEQDSWQKHADKLKARSAGGSSVQSCHCCWASRGGFFKATFTSEHENGALQTLSHLNAADGGCSFLTFLTRVSIAFVSHTRLVTCPGCTPAAFKVLVTLPCGDSQSVVCLMVTFMTGTVFIMIEKTDVEAFTSLFLALGNGIVEGELRYEQSGIYCPLWTNAVICCTVYFFFLKARTKKLAEYVAERW